MNQFACGENATYATNATHARIAIDWLPGNEKIGVRSIRVIDLNLHAQAVVGTFFAADTLLFYWANRNAGLLDCEFEIVYADGLRICGTYHFQRRKKSRPQLMNFVRSSAMDSKQLAPCSQNGWGSRHFDFDNCYETDDFANS